MRVIKIEEVWCSSCLIMKSRIQEVIKDQEIEWIKLSYDEAKPTLEKFHISEDILPIYIREDNGTFLVGEKSKKEIIDFFKEN